MIKIECLRNRDWVIENLLRTGWEIEVLPECILANRKDIKTAQEARNQLDSRMLTAPFLRIEFDFVKPCSV